MTQQKVNAHLFLLRSSPWRSLGRWRRRYWGFLPFVQSMGLICPPIEPHIHWWNEKINTYIYILYIYIYIYVENNIYIYTNISEYIICIFIGEMKYIKYIHMYIYIYSSSSLVDVCIDAEKTFLFQHQFRGKPWLFDGF